MACDEPCECPKLGIDYYGVLGIKKNAHESEINRAFRRLAIRYNPERLEKREKASEVFTLVAEAYDVLSDSFKRAVYDQYGEEGLKKGVPGPDDYIRPYVYHGEPLRTYREFFGTASPYADLLDALRRPADSHDCPEGRGVRRKEEPLVHSLPLSVTEIFFGAVKMMKIQRLVFANDENVDTVLRDKILTIPVKPGLATGTEIVFAEEGDQGPSRIPADIIFVTEDRPHETFSREGDNLCMTVKIFLRDALVGTVVTVNTVDERILRVPVTSIVTPDYRKLVPGEGLPLADDPARRGDLIIRFDVEFPVYLPVASKNYVKKAFKVYRTGESSGDDEYVRRLILTDKMRRNVDDDIPLWRDRDDELERIKLSCTS